MPRRTEFSKGQTVLISLISRRDLDLEAAMQASDLLLPWYYLHYHRHLPPPYFIEFLIEFKIGQIHSRTYA